MPNAGSPDSPDAFARVIAVPAIGKNWLDPPHERKQDRDNRRLESPGALLPLGRRWPHAKEPGNPRMKIGLGVIERNASLFMRDFQRNGRSATFREVTPITTPTNPIP